MTFTNNETSNNQESKQELPLLLRNMKKAFSDKINGPIIQREREYQIVAKTNLVYDITKFLSTRGVTRLAAINIWKHEGESRLAYHFIVKIGQEALDSKITLIIYFDDPSENTIKSIKKLYANARIFEEEIIESNQINFSD
ncbi:MAG: hypothetical protein FK734_16195 [Asgard group archaeon]|nr:hypothetical protein [Asgard group archaeon]